MYLDFSIELRRTQNDQYSAVAGFFKTHELVFIGANERDLMTLRKVRNEQIQLHRLRTPPERAVRCSSNTSNKQTTLP